MIKKKILIIFFFLTSCGYQPILNLKNTNYSIADYELSGDREINKILRKNFNKYSFLASKILLAVLNTLSEVHIIASHGITFSVNNDEKLSIIAWEAVVWVIPHKLYLWCPKKPLALAKSIILGPGNWMPP